MKLAKTTRAFFALAALALTATVTQAKAEDGYIQSAEYAEKHP